MHIVRGFLSLSTFGIPALKTGMAVFFVAVIVLGAGYMLAASGEAGYWGAVVSAFNIVSAAVDFVFKVVWFCCTFAGVLLGVDTNALFAALVGSTTISPSVFFSFLLFVHLSGGIFLFLLVSAHMGSAHGAGTVAGSTLRGSSRAVLSSAVESRDLRFVVALSCTLLIVALGLSWLLRTGNGILLNTEIKPPARVATEVYFSGVYAGFRYMPMVSCVVLFVATTLAFWFFASRAVTKQSRTLLLAACLLSVFVFSVIGFMPVDLVEHLFINAQDACLPC